MQIGKQQMLPCVNTDLARTVTLPKAVDFMQTAREMLDEGDFRQISAAARSIRPATLNYCQYFIGTAAGMLNTRDFDLISTAAQVFND